MDMDPITSFEWLVKFENWCLSNAIAKEQHLYEKIQNHFTWLRESTKHNPGNFKQCEVLFQNNDAFWNQPAAFAMKEEFEKLVKHQMKIQAEEEMIFREFKKMNLQTNRNKKNNRKSQAAKPIVGKDTTGSFKVPVAMKPKNNRPKHVERTGILAPPADSTTTTTTTTTTQQQQQPSRRRQQRQRRRRQQARKTGTKDNVPLQPETSIVDDELKSNAITTTTTTTTTKKPEQSVSIRPAQELIQSFITNDTDDEISLDTSSDEPIVKYDHKFYGELNTYLLHLWPGQTR